MTKTTVITCDKCTNKIEDCVWSVSFNSGHSDLLQLNETIHFCDWKHMMDYLDDRFKKKSMDD